MMILVIGSSLLLRVAVGVRILFVACRGPLHVEIFLYTQSVVTCFQCGGNFGKVNRTNLVRILGTFTVRNLPV